MEYYKNKYLKYKNKYLDMVGGDFKPKHIPKTKDMFASIDKYNSFMKKMKGGNGPTKEEREEFEQMNIQDVGRGSYGCVYAPSLPCKSALHKTPNTIGKLMTKKDAAAEVNNWDLIKNIPEINKYVANFYGKCEPTELTMEQIKNKHYYCDAPFVQAATDALDQEQPAKRLAAAAAEEPVIAQAEPPLDILVYENAGLNNLTEIIQFEVAYPRFSAFKRFIINFKNIMDGVLVLHNNNIVHGDIKTSNIQVSNNVYKLIDFGRAFDRRTLRYTKALDFNIPLDIISMAMPANEISYYIKKVIKLIYENAHLYKPNMSLNITDIYNSKMADENNPQHQFILNIKSKIGDTYKIETLLQKIDVYSIGCLLFKIAYIFKVFDYNEKGEIIINPNVIPHVHGPIFLKLFSLMNSMVDIDPNNRITIEKACDEYNEIYKYFLNVRHLEIYD